MADTTGTTENPLAWDTESAVARSGRSAAAAPPQVRSLTRHDLRIALRRGLADFSAFRSDVVFLCLLYPVIGATLVWVAFHLDFLHLLFPLVAGFALIGPMAGVGLYELSRRREQGRPAGWADALAVLRNPSLGSIASLAAMQLALFMAWLFVADQIYAATLGLHTPASVGAFLTDLTTTQAGGVMIVLGTGIGFLFALAALSISVVSFPLLLERNVGVVTAVATSLRVTMRNPGMVCIWGLIVAVTLTLGAIPAFLGLVVVMPVLGHATWHLYRRAVSAEGDAEHRADP